MSNTGWLIVALICVALFIGGYAAYLVTRRKRLVSRLDELGEREGR